MIRFLVLFAAVALLAFLTVWNIEDVQDFNGIRVHYYRYRPHGEFTGVPQIDIEYEGVVKISWEEQIAGNVYQQFWLYPGDDKPREGRKRRERTE
jgi:hypothetical protein